MNIDLDLDVTDRNSGCLSDNPDVNRSKDSRKTYLVCRVIDIPSLL